MFDLRTYLPYLLNRVGFAVTDIFADELAQDGLTVPMWRTLAVLLHDGPQRLSELSELTSIEISTLSRLVGTMQRRGLVLRRRSTSDGREVNVALSARGRTITERLVPSAVALEERLLGDMSVAEVKRLKLLLSKLFANVADERAAAEAERSA